ncbi:MAG: galactose oxidase [Gammaproteobacteria bacterium]|nr:galactose oxidase [Gammaproteobacteria bacterium]
MKNKILLIGLISLLLSACSGKEEDEDSGNIEQAQLLEIDGFLPDMPVAMTNNAVAVLSVNGITEVYSFLGLQEGKTWQDTSTAAFRLRLGARGFEGAKWTRIRDLPVPQGRLASVAVAVKGKVYIFGGYSVAEDSSEVSQPEVFSFDPLTIKYHRLSDIPVPSDDAVAMVYADRYVYLVSGWHDNDNIDNVQVYDTLHDTWSQATAFPGSPVFGHAGGIVGNTMIICDGVKVNYLQTVEEVAEGEKRKREFVMSDECYQGLIDTNDPNRIAWTSIPSHAGPAGYRMASTGESVSNKVFFIGGTDNPYNYNGIGYNQEPSSPMHRPFAYNTDTGEWEYFQELAQATMDHRSLLLVNGVFATIGGMDEQRNVTGKTSLYSYPFIDYD